MKENELQGGGGGGNSGRGAVDHEKEELYTALMKSNMELETQKLTKTFEEKERTLSQELAKLREQLTAKTKEAKQFSDNLSKKETEMK